jgi:hypothetical protein
MVKLRLTRPNPSGIVPVQTLRAKHRCIIAAVEGMAARWELPKATWHGPGGCFRLFAPPRLTSRRTDGHYRPADRLVGVRAVDRPGEERKAMQALVRQQSAHEDVVGLLSATAIDLQGLVLPG